VVVDSGGDGGKDWLLIRMMECGKEWWLIRMVEWW